MAESKLNKDPQTWVQPAGRIALGCDPELFLANEDGIIGAEKVIPKEGIPSAGSTAWPYPIGTVNGAVLDGVQLELHPPASTCRQSLAANLAQIFAALELKLVSHKGVKVSFDPVVEVSKKELDTLSEDAKKLGCAPSLNTNKASATIKVAKSLELMRSAGGHLHLGSLDAFHGPMKDGKPTDSEKTIQLVNLLDLFVGLPCVLIDRDPQAAKRRRIYGRAGEHRLPPHGVEYRVLSNFWLRNYILMSFVFGQARLALAVWNSSFQRATTIYNPKTGIYDPLKPLTPNHYERLMATVDMKLVAKAINTNNLKLAKAQWAKVADFIEEYVPTTVGSGLSSGSTEAFDYFATMAQEKGLQYWFPDDPLRHWTGKGSNTPGYCGFESYIGGAEIHTLKVMKKPDNVASVTLAKAA